MKQTTPHSAAPKREWAAYVRVSKVNGREGDSFASPRQQEDAIRAALGIKYGATVADDQVYVDLDRTGTDDHRPAFQEALAWVRESPSRRGICVMDGSRLFRNAALFLTTVKNLERVGAEYLSVHEAMDANTPEGNLMRALMAGMHQFTSDSTGRRWRMVQRDRLEAGLPSGGPVRFGYQQTEGERVQSPHPDNGPVLAQMYEDFISGRGAQAIARRLNERGITTQRGNLWNTQGVLRTLDSGFGAGKILANGEYRPGAHQSVISEEQWESYRRTRDSRRVKPPRHKSPRWHLAGLAKCGLCGSNMLVASYRDPKTLVACAKYKATRMCPGTWMSKHRLDVAVTWWLGSRLEDQARHAGTVKQRNRAHARALARADEAKALAAKLIREKVATARLHAAGDLTLPEYEEAKRQNQADMSAAQAALAAAQQEAERLAPVQDVYEALVRFGESTGAAPGPGPSEVRLLPADDPESAADRLSTQTRQVLDGDEYASASDPSAPAVYNTLLTKVIDRIEVHKERVVIVPVVGKPHEGPR